MQSSIKWVSAVLLVGLTAVSGCADSSAISDEKGQEEVGTLLVPLVSYGPSGAKYQLRNASFQITSNYYYATAGAAGRATNTATVVSSESDPGADTIEVSLEKGSYYVALLPGWSMEKVENGVASAVEAQLLSSQSQYLYVNPRTSTWVKFQFGIGERSVWFNGTATIDMDIYENPDQYYGAAGRGGTPLYTAGSPSYSISGARGY